MSHIVRFASHYLDRPWKGRSIYYIQTFIATLIYAHAYLLLKYLSLINVLSCLPELHLTHAGNRLDNSCPPPLLTGIIWSAVLAGALQ